MADRLFNSIVDDFLQRLVDAGDGSHLLQNAMGGIISAGNYTTTPLGAGETFTGSWEVNNFEQAAVNTKSDTNGTLYIDFGIILEGVDRTGTIRDADVITTFTRTVPIYAGSGTFQALAKMPGRAMRIRYTDGGSGQTEFGMQLSYGNHLFPVSATNENEVQVTTAEQEYDRISRYVETGINSTRYAIIVDLSDTTNFKHLYTGRIDITNKGIMVDRDSTATGSVKIGVITRVDATNADITLFGGVTFEKSDTRSIQRDKKYSPSQVKCGVVSGATPFINSNDKLTNVAGVKTGTPLNSPRGSSTVTPAVGDIIAVFTRTAGTYDASMTITYHSDRSAS